MHLSGDLAQSIFLSATSSLEQPALFPVELRGASHHQIVPKISRHMFGGEKLTQFSPLIPFNPAFGNWKWSVFLHTTPHYLKRGDKISCTRCSSQHYTGVHCGAQQGSGFGRDLRAFCIFQWICNHKPSIGRKNMYLFLITAICLFHSPSDTTKHPQINQQVTGEMS